MNRSETVRKRIQADKDKDIDVWARSYVGDTAIELAKPKKDEKTVKAFEQDLRNQRAKLFPKAPSETTATSSPATIRNKYGYQDFMEIKAKLQSVGGADKALKAIESVNAIVEAFGSLDEAKQAITLFSMINFDQFPSLAPEATPS